MATQIEKFAAMWPNDSWSIGQVKGVSKAFSATVHGFGTCAFGDGATPEEAFTAAIGSFRENHPDELTTKRRLLVEARDRAAQLEAELADVA